MVSGQGQARHYCGHCSKTGGRHRRGVSSRMIGPCTWVKTDFRITNEDFSGKVLGRLREWDDYSLSLDDGCRVGNATKNSFPQSYKPHFKEPHVISSYHVGQSSIEHFFLSFLKKNSFNLKLKTQFTHFSYPIPHLLQPPVSSWSLWACCCCCCSLACAYKRDHMAFVFLWFISFSIMLSGSIHVWQMTRFPSFLWPNNIPLYIYHSFCIHSFTDGSLGCFHILLL